MRQKGGPLPVILVVDDDNGIHESLRLLLESEYELVSAVDGAAGLEILERCHVGLILLDLLMPGIDGWEMFERLTHAAGTRPKVLFLTAVDSSAAAVAALKLGADGWILKPFDETALLMQLRSLLQNPQPIVLSGLDLGVLAGLGVIAAVRCGVPVTYRSARSVETPCAGGQELDASGVSTGTSLAAFLRRPPINLDRVSGGSLAAIHIVCTQYPRATVDGIGEAVGLTPKHLSARFKEEIGRPLGDYIARVRVEVIRQRLGQASCPTLDRLAEEAGLCDASHLSKVFGRYVGETPGVYRRMIQGDR
jgi:DNA-binding response OmpR family regulator